MERVETMKLRRRFAGESRGRCLLTNPAQGRGAVLRAVGNERCASLVSGNFGCRAPALRVKAIPEAEIRPMPQPDRRGNDDSTQERVDSELVKPSWPQERNHLEQGSPWQQGRRPEGGRWVRSSDEPPVMRRDPNQSRALPGKVSPSRGEGTQLMDIPLLRRGARR